MLSNIVLDELDQELARRGHRFVRYADDAKVYVRSERAGQRVMASLTEFIEGRLRLKVNEAKSAVARPEDRHFLGFRLRLDPQTGTVEVLLSERTKRNAMAADPSAHAEELGKHADGCIARINAWLRGWHGFFGIVSRSRRCRRCARSTPIIRRRLRAIHAAPLETQTHDRTQPRQAGRQRATACGGRSTQGRKSWWALSHTHAVDQGLRNAYFAKRGLIFLVDLHRQAHQHIVAPDPPQLALWG